MHLNYDEVKYKSFREGDLVRITSLQQATFWKCDVSKRTTSLPKINDIGYITSVDYSSEPYTTYTLSIGDYRDTYHSTCFTLVKAAPKQANLSFVQREYIEVLNYLFSQYLLSIASEDIASSSLLKSGIELLDASITE